SLKKLEQSSSSDVDPLAYLAKSSTPPQPSPKPTTQAAQTHEEALMATMQQLANLLSGFQKQFPPTNNQLRASSNPRSQAMVQAGQIANHEDAYDSDVDDRPVASIAFMAKKISAGSPSSSNNISINENTIPYSEHMASNDEYPSGSYLQIPASTFLDLNAQITSLYKVNEERNQTLEAKTQTIDTLTTELERYKLKVE
nr:hypothetical protein [Tanacetum cinerariifolium]